MIVPGVIDIFKNNFSADKFVFPHLVAQEKYK
jgi:hypothetical protein